MPGKILVLVHGQFHPYGGLANFILTDALWPRCRLTNCTIRLLQRTLERRRLKVYKWRNCWGAEIWLWLMPPKRNLEIATPVLRAAKPELTGF